MKNILIIARLNLLINFRRGAFYALLLAILGVSTLTFYLARSDGNLLNELEIRLNYSYGVTYNLLTLIVIALACFSVRNQLDAKNVHLLTSYPLDRKAIFLGQALAIMIMVVLATIILIGSVVGNAWFYSRGFSQAEKDKAYGRYFQTQRKVLPIYDSKREVALNYLDKKGIDITKLELQEWVKLYNDALYNDTLINPNQAKVWQFDLNEIPSEGDKVYLNYTFQRAKKREMTKGYFELTSPGYNIYFKKEVEAHHYLENRLEIPIGFVPDNGKFEIKFTNTGANGVVVNRAGISFSYLKGTLFENLNKCFLSQVFHLTISGLVGLCAGIGLTFSVATFMVISLYLISTGQPLFQLMLHDSDYLIIKSGLDFQKGILQGAVWLTKGLQAPSVIGDLSAGLNLEWSYLLFDWLPALLLYGLIALCIGCVVMKNKELDKVQV